jgi:hypothetical protein
LAGSPRPVARVSDDLGRSPLRFVNLAARSVYFALQRIQLLLGFARGLKQAAEATMRTEGKQTIETADRGAGRIFSTGRFS